MIDAMWLETILSSVLLAIILAVIARGTIRKTKWGINLKKVHCPMCGGKIPFIRKPTSLKQAIWGGGTCPKCGCEVDKWGRKVEKGKKGGKINARP